MTHADVTTENIPFFSYNLAKKKIICNNKNMLPVALFVSGMLTSLTCDNVKASYQDQSCCSNATEFTIPSQWLPNTLQEVKDRGYLLCGIAGEAPFTSTVLIGKPWEGGERANSSTVLKLSTHPIYGESWGPDELKANNIYVDGIDADGCRAVALAIFNDSSRVAYRPISAELRFDLLNAKVYDVLFRVSTKTFQRERDYKIKFPFINMYDGMKVASLTLTSLTEMDNKTFCTNTASSAFFQFGAIMKGTRNIDVNMVNFTNINDCWQLLVSGQVDAVVSDESFLKGSKKLAGMFSLSYANITIFPEQALTKEPLGPAVRGDDPLWFDLIHQVLNAQVSLWEVENMGGVHHPLVSGLMQRGGSLLNLVPEAFGNVVNEQGSFRQVFTGAWDNLWGENQLYTDGGLFYGIPHGVL